MQWSRQKRVRSFARPLFGGALVFLLACPHPHRGSRFEADASTDPDLDPDALVDAAVAPSAPARPTHSGLISIQHIAVHGLPTAAEGMTVQALFTRVSPPAFDEQPGAPTGCKAYWYELPSTPPPALEDHGAFTIRGLVGGELACEFAGARGYTCKDGASGGSETPFLRRSLAPSTPLSIALAPSGERGFEFPETEVQPGDAFTLDTASRPLLTALPSDGRPVTLSCGGSGGSCGNAQATIVRITTTDADVTGLGPLAMPPPTRRYVEISCAALGKDSITIPEGAMKLLERAHAEGALTRIRTAFMRDGVALVTNAPPAAPNRMVIAAGRGVIGYTDVAALPR